MSLGPWPTKLPMTWDSDIGVDHFDVPIVWNSSGIILYNHKKRRKWSRSPCLALGGHVGLGTLVQIHTNGRAPTLKK